MLRSPVLLSTGGDVIDRNPAIVPALAEGPPAPCECPHHGYCVRHRRRKTYHHWVHCRTSARYRSLWDAQAAALPEPTAAELEPHEPDTRAYQRVGLGDLVGGVTAGLLGMSPCGGCKDRWLRLNSLRVPVPTIVKESLPPPPTTWLEDDPPPGWGDATPQWAVAVTTAPRASPVLLRSLASLCRAGFTQVRVFAEPGSAIPRWAGVVENGETRGVFQNWRGSLDALRADRPDAKFYAIFQDDVVYAANLRQFLEADLTDDWWLGGKVGLVSPYRSCGKSVSVYNRRSRRKEMDWRPSDRYLDLTVGNKQRARIGSALWGACTYVLSPRGADAVLASESLKMARRMIDLQVHPALAAAGFECWYYNPSLAEHLPGESSIGHGQGLGMSSGGTFVGEHFDATGLVR